MSPSPRTPSDHDDSGLGSVLVRAGAVLALIGVIMTVVDLVLLEGTGPAIAGAADLVTGLVIAGLGIAMRRGSHKNV